VIGDAEGRLGERSDVAKECHLARRCQSSWIQR
jgi:hypothetical protein